MTCLAHLRPFPSQIVHTLVPLLASPSLAWPIAGGVCRDGLCPIWHSSTYRMVSLCSCNPSPFLSFALHLSVMASRRQFFCGHQCLDLTYHDFFTSTSMICLVSKVKFDFFKCDTNSHQFIFYSIVSWNLCMHYFRSSSLSERKARKTNRMFTQEMEQKETPRLCSRDQISRVKLLYEEWYQALLFQSKHAFFESGLNCGESVEGWWEKSTPLPWSFAVWYSMNQFVFRALFYIGVW